MPRHKNAEWIIAWAEGKEVQASLTDQNTWLTIGQGSYSRTLDVFQWDTYKFRLKPREPRRVWIVYDASGNYMGSYEQDEEQKANSFAKFQDGECVEFVEVMREEE